VLFYGLKLLNPDSSLRFALPAAIELRVVFIDLGIGTSVLTFIPVSVVRPLIDVNLGLN